MGLRRRGTEGNTSSNQIVRKTNDRKGEIWAPEHDGILQKRKGERMQVWRHIHARTEKKNRGGTAANADC